MWDPKASKNVDQVTNLYAFIRLSPENGQSVWSVFLFVRSHPPSPSRLPAFPTALSSFGTRVGRGGEGLEPWSKYLPPCFGRRVRRGGLRCWDEVETCVVLKLYNPYNNTSTFILIFIHLPFIIIINVSSIYIIQNTVYCTTFMIMHV